MDPFWPVSVVSCRRPPHGTPGGTPCPEIAGPLPPALTAAKPDVEDCMRVQFVKRESAPERLVCEAEVVFDEEGPLKGMKLVGFSLWRSAEGEVYVTFPSRAFGAGNERKYFDFLRSADGMV